MQIETQAEDEPVGAVAGRGRWEVRGCRARNMQCSRWQTMVKGEDKTRRESRGRERETEKVRVKVTLHCWPGRHCLYFYSLFCCSCSSTSTSSSTSYSFFWPSTQLLKDKLAGSGREQRETTAYKMLQSKSHNNLGQTSKLHSV